MSHPWNKSLALCVGTQQLHASLRPARLRRRAEVRHVQVVLDPTQPQALDHGLDTLFAEMQQQADLAKTRLHVTLADAYGHFDVVAGEYANYSDPELQAIALGCVAELMGDAAADQAVRWQLQPDLQHLLICAFEQQLVDRVQRAASDARLTLVSLQPAFCRYWNRHSRALPQGSGVFSVADDGYCLVSCAQQGSITALSYGTGPALDLRTNRLLASLGQAADVQPHCVLVARAPQTLAVDPRWALLDGSEELA